MIRPGKIVMRGAMSQTALPLGQQPYNICGALVNQTQGLIGQKVATGGQVDPWNAPLMKPTAAQLASGSLTGTNIFGLNGTSSHVYPNADSIPGPRWINFYGLWYGISYDSAGAAVQDTNQSYYMKPLSLLTWNANTATETVLSNAPHGAFDLIGYQSRLWLLGGIDTPGAGTTHSPVALFFTNPIVSGGGSATADWQDPVTGLTNKIVMDGDEADFGVGLATVRNGLIILRRASVYLLKGSTTANYTLIPISKTVGCVDARSIVETDNGVYFMSTQGLMFTNGASVINVSGTLTQTLRDAVHDEQQFILAAPTGVTQAGTGYVTCTRLSHGQILVAIGGHAYNTGSWTPLLCALYDPMAGKGGVWTRITSNVFSSDGTSNYNLYPAGPVYGSNVPFMSACFSDKAITAMEDPWLRSSILDMQTTSSAAFFDTDGSGTQHVIPAMWTTPIPAITVANKRVIALARRYYLDYNINWNSTSLTQGWTIQPVDAQGNPLDTAQNVPLSPKPAQTGFITNRYAPTKTITRFNHDWCPEIVDCQFTVSWKCPAPGSSSVGAIAEIYGLGLELQRSRDLRNVP